MKNKIKRKALYLILSSSLLVAFSFLFVLEKVGIKGDGIAKKINKKLLDKNVAQAQCSSCAATDSCGDDGAGGN